MSDYDERVFGKKEEPKQLDYRLYADEETIWKHEQDEQWRKEHTGEVKPIEEVYSFS